MILVQKPSIPQSPLYTYKRHPPASNVVMFPTRTPGLLTFSNSPRPPLQRKPLRKSKSTAVVRAPLLNLPAETTDNKKSGVIALPARGGRGQTKHTKDKVQNRRWFRILVDLLWLRLTISYSDPTLLLPAPLLESQQTTSNTHHLLPYTQGQLPSPLLLDLNRPISLTPILSLLTSSVIRFVTTWMTRPILVPRLLL